MFRPGSEGAAPDVAGDAELLLELLVARHAQTQLV